MTGWVIRLLLLYFVLRALLRLWRGIVEGMNPAPDAPPAAVPLVRDPVCGTFVVPERAIALTSGRDQQYFCSAGCRDKYQAQRAHPA